MLNTVEVNGFYVDIFNQYKLQVGKAEGVCPLCSHQRKTENKKKKCATFRVRLTVKGRIMLFISLKGLWLLTASATSNKYPWELTIYCSEAALFVIQITSTVLLCTRAMTPKL